MSGKHSSPALSRRRLFVIGGGVAAGAVAAGAVVSSASASTGWFRLPVVTANIGRKNLAARKKAIHDVRFADATRPLVGWQEIREGDPDKAEPGFIRTYFADAYQRPFLYDAKSFREPLSVPTPWKVVSRRHTFVHHGIAGVTPSRWINEVVVQHKDHAALEFALINTHYLAGAYVGAKKASLQKLWNEHKEKHKARVLAHHSAGRAVIWTADTNNPNYRKATGWAAEKQVFSQGIDRINWMPGNGTVQLDLLGTKTVDMKVDDHNARVAVFRIRLA